MNKEQLEQLKNTLFSYYNVKAGQADGGCYINGHWLSIQQIINIINENMVY